MTKHPKHNDGIICFNSKNTPKCTFVVMGVERSGTSMVAAVLNALGLHIGDNHDSAVFEDRTIFASMESGDSEKFKSIIKSNNERFSVWGWKRPQAYKYIDDYVAHIHNPKYIVTFRDSLAISLRNTLSVYTATRTNLIDTAEKNLQLSKFVSTCKEPIMCVSYEKSLSNKENFISTLCEFLNVTPTTEQLASALSAIENGNTKYLDASTIGFKGYVDRLNQKIVSGWAKQDNSAEPVKLQVIDNNGFKEDIIADTYREDLKNAKIGSGTHGFRLDLPEGVDINNLDVIVKMTKQKLPRSKA